MRWALAYASTPLIDDTEIVMAAATSCKYSWYLLGAKLRSRIKEVVMVEVAKNHNILRELPSELLEDKEVVIDGSSAFRRSVEVRIVKAAA